MYSYRFTIPDRPTPWKRPRRNGKTYFETAEQTQLKNAIRMLCKRAQGFQFAPKGDPVILTVHAVFALPQTLRKGDTRRMGSRHTMTPDADNISKLIKDALNSVAYHDDCQVSGLIVRKQWSDYSATNVMIELPEHIESDKNLTERTARISKSAQPVPNHSEPYEGGSS